MSTQTDKTADTQESADKVVDAAKDAASKAPAGKSLVTKGASKQAKAAKAKPKGTGKRAANVLETPDQFDAWEAEIHELLAEYRKRFEAGRAVDAGKTAFVLRKVADRGYRAGRRLYEKGSEGNTPSQVLRDAIKAEKDAKAEAKAPAKAEKDATKAA